MTIRWQQQRQAVVDAARRMSAEGLTIGASGNVSVRLAAPDGNPLMAITPSQTRYNRLRPADIW